MFSRGGLKSQLFINMIINHTTYCGASGHRHELESTSIHSRQWQHVPAVYVLSKQKLWDEYEALYIAQTHDLAEELKNNPKLLEAIKEGATEIHGIVATSQAERDTVEADLIKGLNPPLNKTPLNPALIPKPRVSKEIKWS